MTRISASLLPSVAAAVHSYEQNQGQLTTESQFGSDPFIERDLVFLRDQQFCNDTDLKIPSLILYQEIKDNWLIQYVSLKTYN